MRAGGSLSLKTRCTTKNNKQIEIILMINLSFQWYKYFGLRTPVSLHSNMILSQMNLELCPVRYLNVHSVLNSKDEVSDFSRIVPVT